MYKNSIIIDNWNKKQLSEKKILDLSLLICFDKYAENLHKFSYF